MNLQNIDIVKNFIEAYNSFDVKTMLDLVHPEIQFKNISGGNTDIQTSGKEEFSILASQAASLFREREQRIIALEEKDGKTYVEIQYSAVFATNLPNGIKAGDKIELNGKSEYTVKDGLIYSIIDES